MDSVFINTFIWAQIIGFIAVIMNVMIWQIKEPKLIIAAYIPTNLIWALQYFLIGGLIGAIISILAVLRDSCFLTFPEKYHKNVIYLMLLATVVIGIYQYKEIYDLLPLTAMIVFNIGFYFKENRGLLARSSLINSLIWMVYCAHLLSIAGVASAVFLMVSVVIGMYRHEKWKIGKCYRSFAPSLARSLFTTPQTYP